MNKIKQLAMSKAIGVKAIIGLFSGMGLSMFMQLSITPLFLAESGGMKPLDLEFGFSIEYAHSLFMNLTERGEQIYLRSFHGVDYIYTIIMGLGIFFLLALLLRSNRLEGKSIFILHLLPVFLVLSDILENLSIDIPIMLNFPMSLGFLSLTLLMNIIKNLFFLASSLSIVIMTVRLLIVKIKDKRRK